MSELLTAILKTKLVTVAALGEIGAETRRNALKEELQYYVLDFIYHHPEYSTWIMYGGSALRIIHGLDRMSVDLDFEISHEASEGFLEELKQEIEKHFLSVYQTSTDFLTVKITTGRGLLLKFHVGDELSFGHSSKQVHVKIDLNHFSAPKKTMTERWPINRDQLSFVIVTYNMASLMASKIAAIFQRGTRGAGTVRYEEKGRDVYDLLWYMNKKIVPNFDYLIAKNIETRDLRMLFDKLTLKMNKVSDENLKQDLLPLFTNRTYIEHWLEHWRESYFQLLNDYKIRTVTGLDHIKRHQDFLSDNFYFDFFYSTQEGTLVNIRYSIKDRWFDDVELDIDINKKVIEKVTRSDSWNTKPFFIEKLDKYTNFFYQITERHFKKMNGVMVGDSMSSKIISIAADNLNPKEQILLNRSSLLSCELDDLLR